MGVRGRNITTTKKVTYKSKTTMIRKPISKAQRLQVYEKYDGHCAYCGCKLKYCDMQVDHAVAVGRLLYGDEKATEETVNAASNLMPACRKCNFYKGMGDIEDFRRNIANILQQSCVHTFAAQLALKYGILTLHQWNGKFYFETLKTSKKQ